MRVGYDNNYTKENFFDRMMITYPLAMNKFCKWIDDYKRIVKWDTLFDNDPMLSHLPNNIKFHYIPVEMQIGIMNKFFYEEGIKQIISWNDQHELVEGSLKKLEIKIYQQNVNDARGKSNVKDEDTYVKEPQGLLKKPPLGALPKEIWLTERVDYLKGAIERYLTANLPIKEEWVKEINEHLIELNKL